MSRDNKRVRRQSVQRGPQYVPKEFVPKDKVLRWVVDSPANISKKLDLGYLPVNATSQQYSGLSERIGDRTLADGMEKQGTQIVKVGKQGTRSILMEIDLELFLEGREEQESENEQLDRLMKSQPDDNRFYGKKVDMQYRKE